MSGFIQSFCCCPATCPHCYGKVVAGGGSPLLYQMLRCLGPFGQIANLATLEGTANQRCLLIPTTQYKQKRASYRLFLFMLPIHRLTQTIRDMLLFKTTDDTFLSHPISLVFS